MIAPKKIYSEFKKNSIDQFFGVPDSVLKNFLNLIPQNKNFVSANEGSAVSHGIGYYLATKKIPAIYMQNSGLGNAINPLISVAHHKVYSIPLFLVIGWRGSPGSNDEPQHLVKGKITKQLLKLLDIKYLVINSDKDLNKIKLLKKFAIKYQKPVAVLFEKNKITKIANNKKTKVKNSLLRSDFIKSFIKIIKKNTKNISTTGYTSRELNQIRINYKNFAGSDFYMVGGMGHAAALGSTYSLFTQKKVCVLDGDGSMLMHLGALATSTKILKKNFKYILFNNECHESVGMQKTLINNIDLKLMAKSFGFKKYYEIKNYKDMIKLLKNFDKIKKSLFLNVKIKPGSIKNLSRPKNLHQIKKIFLT